MNLKNITPLGWIGIIILFNSTVLGGSSQLGDLALSPGVVKAILAIATLGNGFLGGLVTMFSTQGNMAKAVSNMDGAEPIHVNANASPSLAAAALDPANKKIVVVPGAAAAVEAIAKGT